MKPGKRPELPQLFQSRLDQILNRNHPLFILADKIDWSVFDDAFGKTYSDQGAPGKPIRLMVALQYLKHAFDQSDEGVVTHFLENPYWQYFCGFVYFQHEFPIDPSSMTRFRQRIGEEGVEEMLKALLEVARDEGHLGKVDLRRVNVDTTVQEKAIAFPTDARLYHKMRIVLVREAATRGIELRQNYNRLSKQALSKQSGYARARQMKRARKMTRKLKTYLGRVYRDILRKAPAADPALQKQLQLAKRLLAQHRSSNNKLYSVHAPEVECINKGKAHKRYEFGCKVGMVTSSRGNWILGIKAFHGNPFDGHTLKRSLEQAVKLTGVTPQKAYADFGYRGHDYEGEIQVQTVHHRHMKRYTRWAKRWMRRRSAIEPLFSHLKHGNRMQRNPLKGKQGDQINAILCGCGFNFRKLLRAFALLIFAPEQQLTSQLLALLEAIRRFGYVKDQQHPEMASAF